MKGIVWLASYPKSGNTWFRAFLANLRREDRPPADLNELESLMFEQRFLFDAALGWESSDLPTEAVNRLRGAVQNVQSREEEVFFKVHDCFLHPETREPLFSLEATRAALYFIRNPLDVAASFAHHLGRDIDTAIAVMNRLDAHFLNTATDIARQLPQALGSWSWHVRSWVDAPGLRVSVLRYEDMLARPYEMFTQACHFLGLPDEPERVARALEYSSFNSLQQQEKSKGFREAVGGRPFFRQGQAGGWRKELSHPQVASIIQHHGQVMRRFGYLGPDGEPCG